MVVGWASQQVESAKEKKVDFVAILKNFKGRTGYH